VNEQALRELLSAVREGALDVNVAAERLAAWPAETLGFATVDHHRAARCGFPEVIYAPGKTIEQLTAIFAALAARGGNVLATRATREQFDAVAAAHPHAEYHTVARTITLRQEPVTSSRGFTAVVAAGTSDLPVAEEARITAEIMGLRTGTFYDVGVAGLHRLLKHVEELRRASVLIVVAGMEGALLSVVGGLVRAPVIGVPTSVGYGAQFHGLAPLLTMLNSCASGTCVVNIDNGFGAGYLAAVIEHSRNNATADDSRT